MRPVRPESQWRELVDDPVVVQLADELRTVPTADLTNRRGQPLPRLCSGLEHEYMLRSGEHRHALGHDIALAVLELTKTSGD